MDLNDPRRRLLAVRQANPSIRLSVAPKQQQPTLSVSNTPNNANQSIRVNNTVVDRNTPAAPPRQTPTVLDYMGDTAKSYVEGVAGTTSEIARNVVQGSDNLVSTLAKGIANDEGDRRIDQRRANRARAIDSFFPKQENQQVKTAGEIGAFIAPIAGGNKVQKAAEATNVVKSLLGGNIAQKVAGWFAPKAAESLTTTALSTQLPGQQEKGVGQQLAEGLAIDTAVQAAGGVLGKVSNAFKGKSIVKKIAQTNDVQAIDQTIQQLGVSADPGTRQVIANYLASETDPKAVKEIIKSLEVDPNLQLSPELLKRLEDEGIRKVEKGDTPYGAEYNDGTIRFADQSHVNDATGYHELGHHIFRNELTPEEKALFKNNVGEARSKAAGREGYTEDDLISEDFSDYLSKALTGRIGEVPEALRPVVQKYAKLPDEDVAAIKAAGGQVPQYSATEVVQTVNNKTGQKTFYRIPSESRDDIVKGIDGTDRGAIAGERLDDEVTHVTARSPEDMAKRGFQDGGVYGEVKPSQADNASSAPVKEGQITEQAIAENATKQSGSGGIKFRDPETKKTVERSYDDVETELNNLKNTPPEEMTPQVKARIKSLETKIFKFRSENAKFAFPDASPEVQSEIQKVMDELRGASRQFNKAEKARGQERAARISKGEGAFDQAGGGEAGFRAKVGSLKGKMTESGFTPIQADEATQTKILNDIEGSNLRPFEKLNTQNAIRKIWGANPEKPTASDINYIRKYFGDEMGDAVQEAVKDAPDTWRDTLAKIAGTPRALMATADFSAPGRQGAPLGARFPKEWGSSAKEAAKYAVDSKYYDSAMKEIRDSDYYETMTDRMKLALTGADGQMEEAFASADFAEKIPGYGKVVEGSDRAYAGFLTKFRYEVGKKIIDSYGGVDEFNKFYGEDGDKAIRALGEVINTFTGRGGKAGGLVDAHMKTLSTTLFAPRLWASKLNSLNPAWYVRVAKENPEAAKIALQTQSAFLATAGTILGLAAAAGATVVWDPRSADFAKIKVGNTRYDILGGLQQNIVLLARLITGEKVDSTTGEVQGLGEDFGGKTRADLLVDFTQNKLNPLLSAAARLLQTHEEDGKMVDRFGEDYNPFLEFAKLLTPLNLQASLETADDNGEFTDLGNQAMAALKTSPGMVGIGVSTYGSNKSKDVAVDGEFKGKITDDMVLDDNGKPILDDKGRPVKVKIEDGASALEIKALKDDKKKAALTDQYKRGLSRDDQALLKLEDKQLEKYLEDGEITQEQYDNIADIRKKIENLDGVEVDKDVKTEESRRFLEKFNSMTKAQQEKWLEEPASENSKKIAEIVNKDRSEGLAEFKPSQKLAKLYADYEKKLNENTDWTDIDKRNEAKKFQIAARKLNESNEINDIYAEGSSNDIRTLINEQKITQDDLNAAIQLDNELYAAGLAGLKFSKKFRNEFGFATPSGSDGSGSGGGRGRGGSKSSNAHLTDLMVNVSNSAPAVPKFSSQRRTSTKFRAPGVNPGGGNKTVSVAPYTTTSVSQLRRSI